MRRLTQTALLALALGVALPARATLLYSFEPDLEGWTANATVTLSQSAVGATDGVHSMEVAWATGFEWLQAGNALSKAPDLTAGTKILIDATIPEGFATNWLKFALAFNDSSGWRQTGEYMLANTDPGLHLVELDYSGIAKPDTSGNWFQMFVSVNTGSGPQKTIYVDNVRVVPEPATLLALGAGLSAMVVRRRRR